MLEPKAINKIEQELMELPDKIYQQELKVIEAKEAMKHSKDLLEMAISLRITQQQAPNATEKQAHAKIMTEKEKADLLSKEIAYDKENSRLNRYLNLFTALRKVSAIEIETMKSERY